MTGKSNNTRSIVIQMLDGTLREAQTELWFRWKHLSDRVVSTLAADSFRDDRSSDMEVCRKSINIELIF